jgi:hypothetical protein
VSRTEDGIDPEREALPMVVGTVQLSLQTAVGFLPIRKAPFSRGPRRVTDGARTADLLITGL